MEVCRDCVYFDEKDLKNLYSDSCYCDWYKTYYKPGSSACNHYVKKDSVSSTCYITTMVHDILGKSDDSEVLNNLRDFRNNVLQKKEIYSYILYEYDIVGPKIAKCMKEDNDKELAQKIYDKRLVKISNMIKEGQYLNAIVAYQNLTTQLAVYYNIDNSYDVNNNYDYTKGGHGKVYMMKNKA